MKQIWTLDCETDPFDGETIVQPFIWGAYNGAIYGEFDNILDTISFIKENGGGVVYAHNGGKFDFYFFMDLIPTESKLLIINGRLAKFEIDEIEFRDSYCILPVPLREFNKDDFDYSLLTKENRIKPQNKIKISQYLKSDCVNLYAPVKFFLDTYGDATTIAGAAIKFFNKMTGRVRPQTSSGFFDKFSDFYFGGRVQCFKSGVFKKQLKVIDINSAYPSVMSEFLHPYGNKYTIGNELPKTDAFIRKSFVELTCDSTGCFPYRTKAGLSFPNDGINRHYFITGHEYIAARNCGFLMNSIIKKIYTFQDSINFKEYVDFFSKQKIEAKIKGDRKDYIITKLFLTNLYGKYGSNFNKYEEFYVCHAKAIGYFIKKEGYEFLQMLSSDTAIIKKPIDEDSKRFLNVATAASITGAVRAMLMEAMANCTGVHYCDTDSIVCESFNNLKIHPTELGAWDLEAEVDLAAFAGKKLYAFQLNDGSYKTASKGAILTPEEIFAVANGETVKYANLAPSFGLKGIKFISRNIRKTV